MKTILTSIAAGSLLAALAVAQQPRPRYTVTDLGTLPGGNFSQPGGMNDNGVLGGLSNLGPDGSQHAVLWYRGRIIDIAKPGLLGPNSGAFGVNQWGQVSIQAESTVKDPNNENFCGYGTGLKCLPFFWQGGVMTPLPTLGGYNGTVGNINNRGQVAGIAENSTRDPACRVGVSVGGTGPQVLDFEAVIWGPSQGEMRVLRPLPGDTVGMALWINDNGEAVGASGRCGNTVLPPLAFGPHAVLWEKDGSVHDLGNLGGTAVNIALAINNQGQAVGFSSLTDHSTPFFGTHAFLWTRETGKMRDLGTLPGDVVSGGQGINDRGEVVGLSFDPDGNPRAFLWRNGVMSDLNDLVPAGSPLFLLDAGGINSRGEITGFGVTHAGDVHAFLAAPTNGEDGRESFSPAAQEGTSESRQAALPENARKLLQQMLPFGRFGARPTGLR
jgi:probable HAF family extracellular repeat protein